MSTTSLVTADELLTLPTGMGKRYELVMGELREMSPSGWKHGLVVDNIHSLLSSHIRARDLGRGFGAETGFLIARDPDTVRAPDFGFVAKEHLPKKEPSEAFWPGPPDLAVEVLSPSDKTGDVGEKIRAWLAAGCGAVWVIDPQLHTVAIHRSRTDIQIKTAGETLDGGAVVPGFSCPVEELFR
jgi:Uma2 family endonuclease